MKKLLLIILSAVVVSSAFAGNFDGKGVIPGWKFAPAQVGVGIFNSTNLFDADSVALFSIGLAGIQQHSSIISVGGITELKNNPEFILTGTNKNAETAPIEKAYIEINENGEISVKLPEGILIAYDNRITVTVANKADKTPVKDVKVTVTETIAEPEKDETANEEVTEGEAVEPENKEDENE